MERKNNLKNSVNKKALRYGEKSQLSLEFIIILGLAITVITAGVSYIYTTQKNNMAVTEGHELLLTISSNIEEIYNMDIGSQKTALVKVPKNINDYHYKSHIFAVEIIMFGGKSNFTKIMEPNSITFDNLPLEEGMHTLIFKRTGKSSVKISQS
ncbi:MAG: hypothetical protein ABIG89_03180 [Candidatus Woesearchaeota archaeon]